ncbi:MAG: RluA family pseudouridine synthase [Gemmataceae bacterium]
MDALPPLPVPPELAGQTLAAVLRGRLPGLSWARVRALIDARRVTVRGELCRDPARRLKAGDAVELVRKPLPPPPPPQSIVLRHLDEHVAVVEKPAGMNSVRHPAELEWRDERKELAPTLHDLVPQQIASQLGDRGPRLRIVHRLDKETSGLLVFARTALAEAGLGKQFHAHTVTRRYLAIVSGSPAPGTIRSSLVRDRGDGRRGSGDGGKDAVTHFEVVERLGPFTLVRCRLETGRTHQIRIHLAEAGHPVCGDKVYHLRRDGNEMPDGSGAARLMLHAAELGFVHPATHEPLRWEMPPPADFRGTLVKLRGRG